MIKETIKGLYLRGMFGNLNYEFCDDFGDEIYYFVSADKFDKEYVEKAKSIDGDNYSETFFRYCIVYDVEQQTYVNGWLEYMTEYEGMIDIYGLTEKQLKLISAFVEQNK